MMFSKGKLHAIWLLPLYFLYIFNISFAPFPYYLRTRIILGVLGVVLGVLLIRPYQLSKSVIYFILAVLLLLLPSGITMLINRTVDFYFVQYAVQQVLHLFGAYLLVVLSARFIRKFDLDTMFKLVIYAIALNNMMAVVMFAFPPLQEFMVAIQNYDELSRTKLEEYLDMSFRLYGWGIQTFFMGGLLSGYALVLLAYLMRKRGREHSRFWLTCLFLFIAITGLFIARTTLVGVLIGVAYLFWPHRWDWFVSRQAAGQNIVFIMVMTSACVLGIASLNYLFPTAWDTDIIGYALELYIRVDQGDEMATQSTDHLLTMYIWPDNWQTWLVGDGRFNVPGGFYMDTDVGYLRMIYYFGLIGMTLFFLIQVFLMARLRWLYCDKNVALLLAASLVYVLLLNLKALADVNIFLYLMLWLAVLGNHQCDST